MTNFIGVRNIGHWKETTSFHGPSEISTDRKTFCNAFWIAVMVIMMSIAIFLNFRVVETFLEKYPSTAVNFDVLPLTDSREFRKLVYCPTSYLDITKLINDKVKYGAIVYALILLESDTLYQPITDRVLPLADDSTLKDLREEVVMNRPKFGGGLINFLTTPLTTNSDGELIGFGSTYHSFQWFSCDVFFNLFGRTCELDKVCENRTECFFQHIIEKINDTVRQAGFDHSGKQFSTYLKSKSFATVQEFILKYLVNYQVDEKDVQELKYTVRFRRICQVAIADRYVADSNDPFFIDDPNKEALQFHLRNNIKHISPCNLGRRALSLYTGTNEILENEENSFPFLEDLRTTDQPMMLESNQYETRTTFRSAETRYSNIRRPKNLCRENDATKDKYPFNADAYKSCLVTCFLKLPRKKCRTRIRSLSKDSKNVYCIPPVWITNNSIDSVTTGQKTTTAPINVGDVEYSPGADIPNMDDCKMECHSYMDGYCITYDMKLQIESPSFAIHGSETTPENFTDTIFIRSNKVIMSFDESPQVQIEGLFSQIGGNLGLFLGASWMSFIHLFATCCCYSCWVNKNVHEKQPGHMSHGMHELPRIT